MVKSLTQKVACIALAVIPFLGCGDRGVYGTNLDLENNSIVVSAGKSPVKWVNLYNIKEGHIASANDSDNNGIFEEDEIHWEGEGGNYSLEHYVNPDSMEKIYHRAINKGKVR